jgi:hypothetical protein
MKCEHHKFFLQRIVKKYQIALNQRMSQVSEESKSDTESVLYLEKLVGRAANNLHYL